MEIITLENDHLRLGVAPALGGRMVDLHAKSLDCDIFMPVAIQDGMTVSPDDERIIKGGCYPLVPYSGRIAGGTFDWLGKTHKLRPHKLSPPNSIHGVTHHQAWSVLEQSATSITLDYQHTADAGWGFDFTVQQTMTLTGNTLQCGFLYTNTDTQYQPVGMGFHPFFSAKNLQTIQFPARAFWQTENHLPTQSVPIPTPYDFNTPKPFDHEIDHIFYGTQGDCIAHYDGHSVYIRCNGDYAVVFSNDIGAFFCYEPVQNMTNAHNMQPDTNPKLTATTPLPHGLTALAPSDSHTFSMDISVRET